jgi:hypothetical protein
VSACSQLPLSWSVRLPVAGYFGTTFATSSGSLFTWLVIHCVKISRVASFAAETLPSFFHSGSTRAATSPPSQPGQNSRKRYQRP